MRALLPPLPPVPARAQPYRPGGSGVLDVLGEQHAMLCAALDDLCAPAPAGTATRPATPPGVRRDRLASALVAALCRHLYAEQQYLYPAVRAAVPNGAALADRGLTADRDLLSTLAGPGPADRLDEVCVAVRLHVRRCERRLFPALGEWLDDADLIRLGNRTEIALEAAPTRPHPSLAGTPPWNKVLAPVLGAVDKLRDVTTRRVTYLEDL